LSEHSIPYSEKNVSEEGVKDELFALGYQSTPVVVIQTSAKVARGTIEEEHIIVGFSPSKLAKVLL
jgi:hypothetical protein